MDFLTLFLSRFRTQQMASDAVGLKRQSIQVYNRSKSKMYRNLKGIELFLIAEKEFKHTVIDGEYSITISKRKNDF